MIYFKLEILIPCVAATSVIRRNMYGIKIMWFIGLIFELRIGLVFQYTQLQFRSWFTKYIYILDTILLKKSDFSIFFMIFHCYNHRFLPNFTKSYSKIQTVDSKFILHPKVSLYWFGVKFLWLKDVLFIIR